ncbi:MAG: phosphatase [Patescibacteria group bacterium]
MKKNKTKIKPKYFLIDVDGVMTDGKLYYTKEGKIMKVFGPDDSDALNILENFIKIIFISGDKRGFEISKKRIVDDMGFSLEQVSTVKRMEYIKKIADPSEIIYMGDGIFDHYVFQEVGYSICPYDGFYLTKKRANFVTKATGGNRAVAEACLHILEKFFGPYDHNKPLKKFQASIGWKA